MSGWHWSRYVIEDGPDQRERIAALRRVASILSLEVRVEPGAGYTSFHLWATLGAAATKANIAIYMATDEAPTDEAEMPDAD
ncbi:hypothetical protein [Methylobacterium sp. AMS5]|uniref:hypothetical protein n=1 Tax=Methylobacterium sp. AMS5 TaxID=925818 RepID=UPI00074F933C|nr:hypothetical protein [Methylobacterium sp. AMS5]AMB48438.1 hypothetical protein Y590_26045 [Methylobacterium sp. AMS5]